MRVLKNNKGLQFPETLYLVGAHGLEPRTLCL